MAKRTYEQWRTDLVECLKELYGATTEEMQRYVEQTDSDNAWREMFDDGLTPDDAADEERHAAIWAGA